MLVCAKLYKQPRNEVLELSGTFDGKEMLAETEPNQIESG